MYKYKKIKCKDGITKDEHVLVMEEYLGRSPTDDEIVHHIDRDRSNNNINNLELCLKSIHAKYHFNMGHTFNIAKWAKDNLTKGHGTYACWRRGCKCEPCVMAQREYKKQYRARTGIH